MRYFIIFFGVLLSLLMPNHTHAEEMVTVRLVNHVGNTTKLDIKLKGEYVTLSPMLSLEEGVNYSLAVKDGSFVLKGADNKQRIHGSLILVPNQYDENHRIYVNDQPYLGAMEFVIEKQKYVRPVNQLPLEDYLKGVVPFEVFPTWGIETLKAQALAARTYAVAHADEIINDTISYQVYGGYAWSETATKAVEETNGEVITYNGKLISAFYSASNGGTTESNAHVWGGKARPYFPIKEDPFDPVHPWKFMLHQTQIDLEKINFDSPVWWDSLQEKDNEIISSMKAWLHRNGYPGDIKILSIPRFELADKQLKSKRSVKGSITIEFLHRLIEGTVLYQQVSLDNVDLNRIRPMIGGATFKSYLIESLELHDGIYTMKGKGFGHGVGMSQWGAHIMGKNGKSYREIISFYYPGTKIMKKEQL